MLSVCCEPSIVRDSLRVFTTIIPTGRDAFAGEKTEVLSLRSQFNMTWMDWECMCGRACGHVCMCLWKPEVNFKGHSSGCFFLRLSFSMAWSSRGGLGCPVRNFHGSSARPSLVQGFQVYVTVLGYSTCILGMSSGP